jgi:hypothetical protein
MTDFGHAREAGVPLALVTAAGFVTRVTAYPCDLVCLHHPGRSGG